MKKWKILPRRFYERDPEVVAKDLLGKIIVRKLDDNILSGMIVETEAYYGPGDPASRAYDGMKNFNRPMWLDPGVAFIYNVHKYWMFNVVAHEPGGVGAVLIRAVEPLDGVEIMMKNRGVYDELIELTSGPGRFTVAFKIDKSLNGTDLTSDENPIYIADNKVQLEISSSKRIGVKADLDRNLRFYIKGNKFVSKKT
ncbi:MAG TPA: DNA-3-methyladenine glycosylase [Candidatus Bathyarchaeota archaeon]|nr:DNA-3-methyladenine glycosylase [Candidatus Bathyarchaeota archaeon]